MFENYKIGVRISVIDEATRPIGMLVRLFASAEAAAGKLQTRLASIRSFTAGAGAALLGSGATLAAPLLYAIDKAAEFQKQLIGIQIAARGSTAQMDTMRTTIEKIAAQTVFSNIDVAKMAKLIATGTGLNAPAVSSLLPAYAKFADVQLLMKGTPYSQSVTDAIRLAHTAQHYDPQGLSKYLDLLTKASFIVPGSLSEVGHALKYSQGMSKTALGMDDEQSVLLTALLNRLGFAGSRGGTNMIAALTRTIPGVFGSGLLTGKSGESLREMNLVDGAGHSRLFTNGKFDAFRMIGKLGEYVQREFASHPEAIARQDILKNFQHAFGTQGSRVASLLSSPQALEQLRSIGETFAQYGGVDSIQKTFADKSVAQQWQNAKTNFVSAMTEIGITLLPTVTAALKKFNGYMGELITWMQKNPEKVKEYATNIGKLAIALAALGVVSLVTSAITGLISTLGLLRTAILALNASAALPGAPGGLGRLGQGVAVLGAGYALGTLLNDAFHLDEKIGGGLFNHFNPEWSNYDPNAGQKSQRFGKIQRPIVVHTNVHVDGRKIAEVVTRHQSAAFKQPEIGTSYFDPLRSLVPAGGAGAY